MATILSLSDQSYLLKGLTVMDDLEVLREVLEEVRNGEITINEARERTGLPPIPNGDNRLIIKNGLVVGRIAPDGTAYTSAEE
jgi:hypothetical protein